MPTESEIIANTPAPVTRTSLAQQLRAGGVASGGTLLVHTSLSALGWVVGGPVAVIQALLDCIGPNGTLVMPTQSGDLTDPVGWQAPPVPTPWIEAIRDQMPAYDAAITPTRCMGAVPELFRTWPGVRRSAHPTCSFAAFGPLAEHITANHELESPFGECSPLAKLYALDASILLLGVGFDVCTLLHLAEERAWPHRKREMQGSPILENGVRHWRVYETAPVSDTEHFLSIGKILADDGAIRAFETGNAQSWFFSSRLVVDCAVQSWAASEPLARENERAI